MPLDVDTWEDYEAVLAAAAVTRARAGASALAGRRDAPLAALLDGADYLADDGLATAMFLSLRLPQPLLLEGEAGVGKTEAARALADALGTPLIRLQCYEGMDSSEALYEWNYPRQLLRIRLAEAGGDDARRGRPVRPRVPRPPPGAGGDRAPRAAARRAARSTSSTAPTTTSRRSCSRCSPTPR